MLDTPPTRRYNKKMARRKPFVNVMCALEALLAVLALVAPLYIFPACEPPMHCHFSFMGEVGASSVVIVAAGATVIAKGMEAARALSSVTAVAGLFMILYPSVITGVCESPMMPCHYGLLPSWNLIGGAVMLISTVVFIAAREEQA